MVMESDKGDAKVRTSEAGVITEFLVSEGDDIEVGHELFIVDTEGQAPSSGSSQETPAPT